MRVLLLQDADYGLFNKSRSIEARGHYCNEGGNVTNIQTTTARRESSGFHPNALKQENSEILSPLTRHSNPQRVRHNRPTLSRSTYFDSAVHSPRPYYQ